MAGIHPQLRSTVWLALVPPGSPGRYMSSDIALTLTYEVLKQALMLGLPLLLAILLIGLLISVIQVVTQVQDASISFVPKFIAFLIVSGLLAPWMLGRLTAFGVQMFARLAQHQ
jgi:flagellar biosynthetic protein FliQ